MILPPNTRTRLASLVHDPAAAAAWAPALVPAVRTDTRDAMIRVVLAQFYAGAPITRAAKALACDLAAPLGGTPRDEILAAILALNDEKPIRWRRICDIAS